MYSCSEFEFGRYAASGKLAESRPGTGGLGGSTVTGNIIGLTSVIQSMSDPRPYSVIAKKIKDDVAPVVRPKQRKWSLVPRVERPSSSYKSIAALCHPSKMCKASSQISKPSSLVRKVRRLSASEKAVAGGKAQTFRVWSKQYGRIVLRNPRTLPQWGLQAMKASWKIPCSYTHPSRTCSHNRVGVLYSLDRGDLESLTF